MLDRRHTSVSSESAAKLERFFAGELGVSPEMLREPGWRVVSSPNREARSWHGYNLPLLLLSRSGSTVVSVAQEFVNATRQVMDTLHEAIDPRVGENLVDLVAPRFPGAKSLSGYAMYCEPDQFRPCLDHPSDLLRPTDPQWDDMRAHFDGPVFVARVETGQVGSWAGIKCKAGDVWEISVVTEEAYRRRGLAKVVVSAAARYILDHGAVPLYVYPATNEVSGRVARSLGFTQFALEAYCSVSDSDPTGMW